MKTQELNTLAPCPFCGKQPVTFGSGDGQRGLMIECMTDGCVNPHVSNYDHATAKKVWNIRTAVTSQASDGLCYCSWGCVEADNCRRKEATKSDLGCDDCPPVGYPTDKTRCLPCPRRPSPASVETATPAQEVAGYVCTGCGRLAKDPVDDMKSIRESGAVSCCPDRNMKAVYLHPAPAPSGTEALRAKLDSIVKRAVVHPADDHKESLRQLYHIKTLAEDALAALSTPAPAQQAVNNIKDGIMTDDQIKHLVNRFLGWKLPEHFNPDGGISFKRTHSEQSKWGPQKYEPTGTNLFDAIQATEMVRYMVEGLPAQQAVDAEAVENQHVWSARTHDEIIKRLMAQVGMPNSTSLYCAFKQFANELHALALIGGR